MLLRFEPFRAFDPITEELRSERRVRQIPVDAYRQGNEFKLLFDLPGVDSGSIGVTVEKDVLGVRATRTWRTEGAEGADVQVAERGYGEFGRQLFLGESLDRDRITAIYHDGVLSLTIPVSEKAKPRKVEVLHVGSMADAVEVAAASV